MERPSRSLPWSTFLLSLLPESRDVLGLDLDAAWTPDAEEVSPALQRGHRYLLLAMPTSDPERMSTPLPMTFADRAARR
jgi:hypothetical protein